MATLASEYFPFATGPGSDVTEAQWREMADEWMPTGVVYDQGNGLAVAASLPNAMTVTVDTGQVRIRGHVGVLSALITLAIGANANANPRIDLVIARVDFVNERVEFDVLAGAPLANPVEPALTQTAAKWEIALGAVLVPGANPAAVTDIRDRRTMVRNTRDSPWKEPVRVATTAALAASTPTATTRVANANGALANIDGVALVPGDRLLDKDNATAAARGIWVLVDAGSATRPWRMERPADAASYPTLRSGATVKVTEGTANVGTEWVLTTANPIVVGATALTFSAGGGSSTSSFVHSFLTMGG